jgi:hypothetical protein
MKEMRIQEHFLSRIGMSLDDACAGKGQCAECSEKRQLEAEAKLDSAREEGI